MPKKPTPQAESYFFTMGKIVRPHGVRGELKLDVLSHNIEWLKEVDVVYLGTDPHNRESAKEYTLETIRQHRGDYLIKLASITDRDAADRLRDQLVMIGIEQAEPLQEDEFFTFEIVGMKMYTVSGEYLGEVVEIMETGANDVFIVEGTERGTVLIPDIEQVITKIDPDTRTITITPLPGLLSDTEEVRD